MKKSVIGIMAHVDAGKTTLSEAMLYTAGSIRNLGRVDNKNAFLDTYSLERERGITIFSKEARLELENTKVTLLDTPGHVDFSAEMERVLQVLDYAILVISGADGVQAHSLTLWKLLETYKIPTFLFINKMDQNGVNQESVLHELKERFHVSCINFGEENQELFMEEIAMTDEALLEDYIEAGSVDDNEIVDLIARRQIFPCFFGSALKMEGIDTFMKGLDQYISSKQYSDTFGAKVYKISRDNQGKRLTHLKITGGSLKVRDLLQQTKEGWEEKVNQIRLYSGEKFEVIEEVEGGEVCAVTGLTQTYPGEGLGKEVGSEKPQLEPVLSYRVVLPEGCDGITVLPKLKEIEEEEPELCVDWNEELEEIQVKLMGAVQIEILQHLIEERFGILIGFDRGNIIYKETITDVVEGVGHYEPLRHYAEVHVIMEPQPSGTGMIFETKCSEDILDRNWQRLILTHLQEKEHRGVLIGAAITDMKITLVTGKAHNKHTEGGDFREATYRAVRQGLCEANSVLLEPIYEYRLEVPEKSIGRGIADIERMYGTFEGPQIENGIAVLEGTAPVVCMQDYHQEVIAYTKGQGRLFCGLSGYRPCHNEKQVVEEKQYNAEEDVKHPSGSVFCAHGAGYYVSWSEVKEHMHLPSCLVAKKEEVQEETTNLHKREEKWMGVEEVDAILESTYNANKGKMVRPGYRKKVAQNYQAPVRRTYSKPEHKEEYLLVDGYNVIYAWEELKELAAVDINGARGSLMDTMCNFQGIRKCNLILVFDAYRVPGGQARILEYHNIHVVYTKEAETADQYIEKFAHENTKKYNVTVATSDGMEQIIIRGAGCNLISSRELKEEVQRATKEIQEEYADKQPKGNRNYLLENQKEMLTDALKSNTISK